MATLVDGFSLLAIITSYIGFVLGLTDFLSDLLQVRPVLLVGGNLPVISGCSLDL